MARLGVVVAAGILSGGAAVDAAFAEVGEFTEPLVCVGRPVGGSKVKITCQHEFQRGNRIYRETLGGTVDGSAAKGFVGRHTNCRKIPNDDGTSGLACKE